MEADKDRDGKISFEEFTKMVANTDVSNSMTLGELAIETSLTLISWPCNTKCAQGHNIWRGKIMTEC